VRTAGALDSSTVVEEVVGGNLVRFAVFPHRKHKDLLSIGIFLDVAKRERQRREVVWRGCWLPTEIAVVRT
jgi:hypothetical protein